jgi:hypothetical protein
MAGVTGPRLPLQGGLAPAAPATGAVVEIACDESGFSGTNLLDSATPVFTHASTDLDVAEAEALVAELRSGSRWSLGELKSAAFFRSPHAAGAAAWLLGALAGRAHVHVIDKELFLVTRVVDLFLVEPTSRRTPRGPGCRRPTALPRSPSTARGGGRRSGSPSSPRSSTWPAPSGGATPTAAGSTACSALATPWLRPG